MKRVYKNKKEDAPEGFQGGVLNQTPNPFKWGGGLKPETRKGFRFGLKAGLNPL